MNFIFIVPRVFDTSNISISTYNISRANNSHNKGEGNEGKFMIQIKKGTIQG